MSASRRSRAARHSRGRTRVRVRESRYGRELIVNGTFASFYHPGRVATGSVWDAIAAPLLALPPERRRSVLLLGLGGGSVARLVRAVAPEASIVGVELDPEVMAAARSSFDLDSLGLEVRVEDAHSFLERERRSFDIVFEDVFVGMGDAVRKPDWLPRPGHLLAAQRVAPEGLLVSNTLDETSRVAAVMAQLYPALVRIDVEEYDNRILVAGPIGLQAGRLRRAVAENPLLSPTLPRLRFRTLQ